MTYHQGNYRSWCRDAACFFIPAALVVFCSGQCMQGSVKVTSLQQKPHTQLMTADITGVNPPARVVPPNGTSVAVPALLIPRPDTTPNFVTPHVIRPAPPPPPRALVPTRPAPQAPH